MPGSLGYRQPSTRSVEAFPNMSSTSGLELWVFHDNGSRQSVLETGMEVLLETNLPSRVATTLVLRATVLGTMDTSQMHEQKGRFTMVLGELRGYLLPSDKVRMRTNGDLQEWCYPDSSTMPADEIVAWVCTSQESIAIIFSPVRSETGRWYPRKKNEGAGFRSLPAMFRSSGVGYMKLGDINTSRYGNQFLSFDKCRTFCDEGAEIVLRRLGLPTDAISKCRFSPPMAAEEAAADEDLEVEEPNVLLETACVRTSKRGGFQVDENRFNLPKLGEIEARSLPNSGEHSYQEGKYSPRNFEEKYTPRESSGQNYEHNGKKALSESSGETGTIGFASASLNNPKATVESSMPTGISLSEEQNLREKLGPPPSLHPGVSVVSRSTINNITSLKNTLEFGNAGRTDNEPSVENISGSATSTSELENNASAQSGTHKHVKVHQYKPPSGKPRSVGRKGSYSSRTGKQQLHQKQNQQGRKVPDSTFRRAGRHKRATTPAEQKRTDAHAFQSLMDYMKGDISYFEGCERGTTEYNVKIQRLVQLFEEWKVDGRRRPLLEMAAPIVATHKHGSTAVGEDASGARDDAGPGNRRSGRGGIVVELDGGVGGSGGSSAPKSPEERAKERRNYNEMFQAFLAHARSRGFFDGCEKGTPEYNLKIQQCIAKFEELKAKNL